MMQGMSGSSTPQQHLAFFEFAQEQRADGSIVVKPKRLVDGKEISAKKAAGMLNFKDVKAVYRLVRLGKIVGWKPECERDNGKYRIDLGSVLDYKAKRKRAEVED